MQQIISDNKLWEDFKKGEKYALSHIYYHYVDQLFRYGRKFSTDDDLIKDTIQDLFFDLIRTRDNLGNTNHIYFYLLKAFRRRLFKNISDPRKIQTTDDVSEEQIPHIVYSIEDDLIQKEQLTRKEELIRKGLSELSPRQREILYYRFTCDFEYEQICEIMSMKYDSARKMVFRALQSLREHLAESNISLLFLYNQRFTTL